MSTFRLTLKQVRKATGMTQREVAEKANVSLGTYRTWEQGTSGMSLEMACAVSRVLGCTPNDLCGWYEDHPQDKPCAPLADPYAQDLLNCYRRCTPERKASLVQSARDAALASVVA